MSHPIIKSASSFSSQAAERDLLESHPASPQIAASASPRSPSSSPRPTHPIISPFPSAFHPPFVLLGAPYALPSSRSRTVSAHLTSSSRLANLNVPPTTCPSFPSPKQRSARAASQTHGSSASCSPVALLGSSGRPNAARYETPVPCNARSLNLSSNYAVHLTLVHVSKHLREFSRPPSTNV